MSDSNNSVEVSYNPQNNLEQIKRNVQLALDKVKNLNRLDALVTSECGKKCLANLKDDKLSNDEILCFSTCAHRYFDALEIGDKVFAKLDSGFMSEDLNSGKYADIVKNL